MKTYKTEARLLIIFFMICYTPIYVIRYFTWDFIKDSIKAYRIMWHSAKDKSGCFKNEYGHYPFES